MLRIPSAGSISKESSLSVSVFSKNTSLLASLGESINLSWESIKELYKQHIPTELDSSE